MKIINVLIINILTKIGCQYFLMTVLIYCPIYQYWEGMGFNDRSADGLWQIHALID
jgi:hypothetical protein